METIGPFNIKYDADTIDQQLLCKGLCGIENLDQTCYLNSIVQCLSNTKWLRNYILTDIFRDHIDMNKHHFIMVNELSKVFRGLWWNNALIRPEQFVYWTRRLNDKLGDGQFATGGQKDSGEFLIYLLDMVHESLSKPLEDMCSIDKTIYDFYKNGYSEIVHKFGIHLNNSITCTNCGHVSTKYDPANVLTLEIPNCDGTTTLHDCLGNFMKVEHLDDDNKYKCEKCNVMTNAEKKLNIVDTSEYLIINLKRFEYVDSDRIIKKNVLVDFPIDNLDMSKYIKNGKRYRLYSTSNHIGSRNAGHYYSCCLNNEKWYKYDDAIVTTLNITDIVNPTAYVLFYEQI
jgi:ubiquitin carboxyl-terminal hydrolase 8